MRDTKPGVWQSGSLAASRSELKSKQHTISGLLKLVERLSQQDETSAHETAEEDAGFPAFPGRAGLGRAGSKEIKKRNLIEFTQLDLLISWTLNF